MTQEIMKNMLEYIVLIDGTPLEKPVRVKNGTGQVNAKVKRKGIIVHEKMGYNKYAHYIKRIHEEKYPGKKINIKYLGKTI